MSLVLASHPKYAYLRETPDESPATLPPHLESQRSAFEAAAAAIESGAGTGPGAGALTGSPGGALEVWARTQGKLVEEAAIDALPIVSNSTSEHEVRYRPLDERAVKKTWAGFYGQIPVALDGKLGRRNATPVEYLRRMALQIAVFQSDLKLEGVCISNKPSMILFQPPGEPSLVISQAWLKKQGNATTEEIGNLLKDAGFKEVPGSYFGWFRQKDGVVIVDAKPDNFIRTPVDLIPIDLQMRQFEADEMRAAGLI